MWRYYYTVIRNVFRILEAVKTMDDMIEKTEFITDAEGKADITISDPETGIHVISAVSDTQALVPPVCLAWGYGEDTETSHPTTGVSVSLAGLALSASAVIISRKRK